MVIAVGGIGKAGRDSYQDVQYTAIEHTEDARLIKVERLPGLCVA